jgi:hypothetical protein
MIRFIMYINVINNVATYTLYYSSQSLKEYTRALARVYNIVTSVQ